MGEPIQQPEIEARTETTNVVQARSALRKNLLEATGWTIHTKGTAGSIFSYYVCQHPDVNKICNSLKEAENAQVELEQIRNVEALSPVVLQKSNAGATEALSQVAPPNLSSLFSTSEKNKADAYIENHGALPLQLMAQQEEDQDQELEPVQEQEVDEKEAEAEKALEKTIRVTEKQAISPRGSKRVREEKSGMSFPSTIGFSADRPKRQRTNNITGSPRGMVTSETSDLMTTRRSDICVSEKIMTPDGRELPYKTLVDTEWRMPKIEIWRGFITKWRKGANGLDQYLVDFPDDLSEAWLPWKKLKFPSDIDCHVNARSKEKNPKKEKKNKKDFFYVKKEKKENKEKQDILLVDIMVSDPLSPDTHAIPPPPGLIMDDELASNMEDSNLNMQAPEVEVVEDDALAGIPIGGGQLALIDTKSKPGSTYIDEDGDLIYNCANNESLLEVALRFNLPIREVLIQNQEWHQGIQLRSKLIQGTPIMVPPPDNEEMRWIEAIPAPELPWVLIDALYIGRGVRRSISGEIADGEVIAYMPENGPTEPALWHIWYDDDDEEDLDYDDLIIALGLFHAHHGCEEFKLARTDPDAVDDEKAPTTPWRPDLVFSRDDSDYAANAVMPRGVARSPTRQERLMSPKRGGRRGKNIAENRTQKKGKKRKTNVMLEVHDDEDLTQQNSRSRIGTGFSWHDPDSWQHALTSSFNEDLTADEPNEVSMIADQVEVAIIKSKDGSNRLAVVERALKNIDSTIVHALVKWRNDSNNGLLHLAASAAVCVEKEESLLPLMTTLCLVASKSSASFPLDALDNNGLTVIMIVLSKASRLDEDTSEENRETFSRCLDIVDNLIIRGADPNGPSAEGLTPLGFAVKCANGVMIQRLLEHDSVDSVNCGPGGMSAMHIAAEQGADRIVTGLWVSLRGRGDLNLKNEDGKTPYEVTQPHDYRTQACLLELGAHKDVLSWVPLPGPSGSMCRTMVAVHAESLTLLQQAIPDLRGDDSPTNPVDVDNENSSADVDAVAHLALKTACEHGWVEGVVQILASRAAFPYRPHLSYKPMVVQVASWSSENASRAGDLARVCLHYTPHINSREVYREALTAACATGCSDTLSAVLAWPWVWHGTGSGSAMGGMGVPSSSPMKAAKESIAHLEASIGALSILRERVNLSLEKDKKDRDQFSRLLHWWDMALEKYGSGGSVACSPSVENSAAGLSPTHIDYRGLTPPSRLMRNRMGPVGAGKLVTLRDEAGEAAACSRDEALWGNGLPQGYVHINKALAGPALCGRTDAEKAIACIQEMGCPCINRDCRFECGCGKGKEHMSSRGFHPPWLLDEIQREWDGIMAGVTGCTNAMIRLEKEQKMVDSYSSNYVYKMEDKEVLEKPENNTLWEDYLDSAARDLLVTGRAKDAVGRLCIKRIFIFFKDKLNFEKLDARLPIWRGETSWNSWVEAVYDAPDDNVLLELMEALFNVLDHEKILREDWLMEGAGGGSMREVWLLDLNLAREGHHGYGGGSLTLFRLLWRLTKAVKSGFWVLGAGMGDRAAKKVVETHYTRTAQGYSQLRGRLQSGRGKKEMTIKECHRGCLCAPDCLHRAVGLTTHTSKPRLAVCRLANKGWGLKTEVDLPADTYVASYLGLTHSSAEHTGSQAYFHDLSAVSGKDRGGTNGLGVDTRVFGNEARFLNHSCDPNLRKMLILTDRHDSARPHLAFFTIRDVKAGEEVCIKYAEAHSLGFVCRCGARNCSSQKSLEM